MSEFWLAEIVTIALISIGFFTVFHWLDDWWQKWQVKRIRQAIRGRFRLPPHSVIPLIHPGNNSPDKLEPKSGAFTLTGKPPEFGYQEINLPDLEMRDGDTVILNPEGKIIDFKRSEGDMDSLIKSFNEDWHRYLEDK